MRFGLITLALATLMSQVGCAAEQLPWAGTVAISDPPGLPYPRLPALSPSGESLAVLGSSQFDINLGYMWIWNIAERQWLQAPEESSRPISADELTWDATSTQLVYNVDRGLMFVTPATGETIRQETPAGTVIPIFGPERDQYTGFILARTDETTQIGDRVSILSPFTEHEEILFELDRGDPNAYSGMDWSPDGTKLLVSFWGSEGKGGSYDIFLYDSAAQGWRRLIYTTDDEYEPKWSSDGRWFVYIARRYGEYGSDLVFSSSDATCEIRFPVNQLLMDLDWGSGEQLVVVYSNQQQSTISCRYAAGFRFWFG